MRVLNKQEVEFNYGLKKCKLELPADNLISPIKRPRTVKCNLAEVLKTKLEQSNILKYKISSFPKYGKVTLVVDDYTRPTPTNIILPVVLDFLNKHKIKDNQIILLIASGFHREMTALEKESKYGKNILRRIQCIHHDASNENKLTYMGKTSTKIPVYLNNYILQADLTIGIGIIEIHPWAGFSGGGKIISPGVAGKITIDYTHSLPILKPNVEIAKTKGNSFWESCLEISEMSQLDLVLNIILNINQQPAGVFFGNVREVHNAGIELFNKINRISFPEKADIVITTANPKFQSFGQALTSSFNAARLVKEGGIRIILADCPEGFGDSVFEELFYYDALVRKWNTPMEFWENRKGEKAKNSRNACAFYRHLELSQKSNLFFVTNGFPEFVKNFDTLEIFKTPKDALNCALSKLGLNASIITFDLGGMILACLGS